MDKFGVASRTVCKAGNAVNQYEQTLNTATIFFLNVK